MECVSKHNAEHTKNTEWAEDLVYVSQERIQAPSEKGFGILEDGICISRLSVPVLNNCREKDASEFFFCLFVFLIGKDAGIIYGGPALYP